MSEEEDVNLSRLAQALEKSRVERDSAKKELADVREELAAVRADLETTRAQAHGLGVALQGAERMRNEYRAQLSRSREEAMLLRTQRDRAMAQLADAALRCGDAASMLTLDAAVPALVRRLRAAEMAAVDLERELQALRDSSGA